MWCLLLDLIGNNQGISAMDTTMWRLNGLIVVMGARTMAHEAIFEGRMVEEMVGLVEDTDKK
jgi:hypothetical protein